MMNNYEAVPVLACTGLSKLYGGFPALSELNLVLRQELRPQELRPQELLPQELLPQEFIPQELLPQEFIPKGRIIGLLGPNGSGKTTLIKLAAGLLTPTFGEIRVFGLKPGEESKALVSYLPEQTYFNENMTVGGAMSFFSDFYADFEPEAATEMLSRLGISVGSRFKTLSKGTKEKVQLIMVMSRRARLYLLDEPIGGVDPASREYILSTILSGRSEQSTVLISTHLIADVEGVLDDFIFLQNGKMTVYDSVERVRREYGKSVDALFREVFRC